MFRRDPPNLAELLQRRAYLIVPLPPPPFSRVETHCVMNNKVMHGCQIRILSFKLPRTQELRTVIFFLLFIYLFTFVICIFSYNRICMLDISLFSLKYWLKWVTLMTSFLLSFFQTATYWLNHLPAIWESWAQCPCSPKLVVFSIYLRKDSSLCSTEAAICRAV